MNLMNSVGNKQSMSSIIVPTTSRNVGGIYMFNTFSMLGSDPRNNRLDVSCMVRGDGLIDGSGDLMMDLFS